MSTRRDALRAGAAVVLAAARPVEASAARPVPAPERKGYLLVYGDATGSTECGTVIITAQADGSWLVRPDPTSAEGWLD
ncbi:MAG: hypothetical protein M3R02_12005 [Chloroflexota bacterium]|nr:hypothetical protein [Chloroflexota bacterium]